MKTFLPTSEQAAVLNYSGSCVITACPGSGKTAVIAAKVREILANTRGHQGVIAISYTRKASAELRQRCTFDGIDTRNSFFGTIDAFSISEVIRQFLPHFATTIPSKLEVLVAENLEENASLQFERLLTADVNAVIPVAVELFENGVLILESVPRIALALLHSSSACRKYLRSRYTHLFIDEYQDTGEQQHQLFMGLYSLGITSTAVGDLRQSIYAYDGRNPKYLEKLTKDSEIFAHFELTQNHRSHVSIINYSNRLRDPSAKLLPCDKLAVYRKTIQGDPDEISAWIDEKHAAIMEHFNVEHRSGLAILARSNASAERIAANLQTPHKLFKDSILENAPTKYGKLFSVIIKMRLDCACTVQSVYDELDFQAPRLEKQRLRQALDQCKRGKPDNFFANIIRATEILTGSFVDSESKDELRSVLENPAQMDTLRPASKDQIQVMTLHKSKGLEFDVVLHLDLYDWIIPGRRLVDNSSEPVFKDYEQCLNLHYVGVTRAKKACFLLNSTQRFNFHGRPTRADPSQFLLLPGLEGLYKQLKNS